MMSLSLSRRLHCFNVTNTSLVAAAGERIVELEDAVKLLQCSQRQYSTPMKSAASPLASPSPVVTQVISLREHHDILNAQRQKLTSLKFEVKTAQQESSAMRQRSEKVRVCEERTA